MKIRVLCSAVLLLGSLALASVSLGQGPGGPPPGGRQGGGPGGPGGRRRGPMDQPILDKLHLTAAQKKKVDALHAKQRSQMDAMRKSANGDREKMRAQWMKMRAGYEKSLKGILTKSQFKTYQAEVAKRRAARGPGIAGAPRPR